MRLRPPNPTIRRCPSCDAELKERLHGRAFWIDWAAWAVFILSVTHAMPSGVALLCAFVLLWPWGIASRRLYLAVWHWWHPERCGGDRGQFAPQPT